MRRLLGFIAAIASVPLAIFVAFAILAVTGFGSYEHTNLKEWIGTATLFSVYAIPVALGVGLVIGLPAALIIESAGRVGARSFVVLGAIVGVAPFAILDLIVVALEPSRVDWRDIHAAAGFAGLGVWCGVCAALVYWQIALKPRRVPL